MLGPARMVYEPTSSALPFELRAAASLQHPRHGRQTAMRHVSLCGHGSRPGAHRSCLVCMAMQAPASHSAEVCLQAWAGQPPWCQQRITSTVSTACAASCSRPGPQAGRARAAHQSMLLMNTLTTESCSQLATAAMDMMSGPETGLRTAHAIASKSHIIRQRQRRLRCSPEPCSPGPPDPASTQRWHPRCKAGQLRRGEPPPGSRF